MYFKKSSKKSQSAIEFMSIFSVFLILTSTFYLIFINYSNNVVKKRVYFQTKNLLELISAKINTVILEGEGFETSLVLPYELLGLQYSLEIKENILLLTLNKYNISETKEVLPVNISGNLKKGKNKIKNVGGGVLIE